MKARWSRGHVGQALVEFAIVLPVFILLILGFVDLARYVFIQNSLAEAAREGARYAIVEGRWKNDADVIAHTQGLAVGVPSPVVTVSCVDVSTGSASTPPDARCARPGYVLQINVTSNAVALALSSVIGPVTVSATSQVAITN